MAAEYFVESGGHMVNAPRAGFRYVFRVLPGILFLFSATAKLISIDSFEIYIFGFGLLPLGWAFLAARLVIALEYFLAIMLIVNVYPKFSFRAAIALLAAFTLFLLYLLLAGKDENCNCFGDLIELSPGKSIIKNLLTAAVLIPGIRIKPFRVNHRALLAAVSAVVPLCAVFIVSPPDNWDYEGYSRATTFNRETFDEALSDGSLPASLVEGDKVVCFYSLKCEFCRLSAKKIAVMRRMGTFSGAPVVAIFGRGKVEGDALAFSRQTGLDFSEYHFIAPELFLHITNGGMPLILVLHDGREISRFSYRDIR